MRSRAEIEKMRRHLLEVAMHPDCDAVAISAGFAADALSWVLREPGLHPVPFDVLLKQLDATEGNTPN